jgi:hypothetical protein
MPLQVVRNLDEPIIYSEDAHGELQTSVNQASIYLELQLEQEEETDDGIEVTWGSYSRLGESSTHISPPYHRGPTTNKYVLQAEREAWHHRRKAEGSQGGRNI